MNYLVMIFQTKIIILVILIAFSAFFSGVEIAFFSLSKLRVKFLIRKKIANAHIVEKLKNNPNKLLSTILIGNNIVNVGATALATSIAYDLSLNYAVGLTTGIMTLILLVFGEITPKSFAAKHNEKICLIVARPMLTLQNMLSPLTFLFELLTNFIVKPKKKKPVLTEEELKNCVSVGEEEGIIKDITRKMIHNIFLFDDLEAKDIMTHSNKIVSIHIDSTVEHASNVFIDSGRSRLPVYEGFINNIKGFININDVQKLLLEGKKNSKIRKIKRKVIFVQPSKKIDRLLKLMQQRRRHLAIVVNRYGRSVGLVSIEDILEEIVGEIFDEMEEVEK